MNIGDTIPDLEIPDHENKPVNLLKFVKQEQKKMVVYFYPKDNTPGCTKEACSFRDDFSTFQEENVLIFGVSKDNSSSHIKFINKFNLPFPLLTDVDLKLTKAFGSFGEKRTGGLGLIRSTFVIDENGKIIAIFGLKGHPKVTTDKHAKEILQVLQK
jgi:peroxiredoxin Q/BCP